MNEKPKLKTFSDSNCRNEVAHQDKELAKITGILTSRIETKNKNGETYSYGFFQIEGQSPEIPVIFKTKPSLEKGSQVQLTGT